MRLPTAKPWHGPTTRTFRWPRWQFRVQMRPYVAAVYAFARTADDFADEGDRARHERLRRLDEWGDQARSVLSRAMRTTRSSLLSWKPPRQTGIPRELRWPICSMRFAWTSPPDDMQRSKIFCSTAGHSANPVGRSGAPSFRGGTRDGCASPVRCHLYGPAAGQFLAGSRRWIGQGAGSTSRLTILSDLVILKTRSEREGLR